MEIFFICIVLVGVHSYEISDSHGAMMYLNRFGYIDDEDMSDKSDMSMSSMKPMIQEFQKMCHLSQTGDLDSKTMEMMNVPRCGNLDMNLTGHHSMFLKEMERENQIVPRRYRRFAITDPNYRWTKRELTWKMGMFSQNTKNVKKADALQEIHLAFSLWSEVTNLDFIHTPNHKKVDIELSFTKRYHIQDDYPFDGPGKTLAHAFPPGEGVLGDVHFEDEEKWSIRSAKGINVLFVAVHEIGHALGLSHSKVKGSIMAPFYGGYSPKLQLHPDDIEGIQSLYGKREGRHSGNRPQSQPAATTTTRSTTTTLPPIRSRTFPTRPTMATTGDFNRPDLCRDSKIDAITALKDGSIYAFKENYVFQIDGKGKGVITGWPHRVDAVFQGLEGNLDAAVTRKNGKTYFFKGSYYWRFTRKKLDSGYPKKISVHFKGIPDSVDSAFEWLDAIYFTKGDKIWRFDPSARQFVSDKYPISLDRWFSGAGMNIPKLDASFKAPNGHIYFFYDQVYWRFDEREFKVSNDLKTPYPRSSKVWWFGCTGGAPKVHRSSRQQDLTSYFFPYEQPDY